AGIAADIETAPVPHHDRRGASLDGHVGRKSTLTEARRNRGRGYQLHHTAHVVPCPRLWCQAATLKDNGLGNYIDLMYFKIGLRLLQVYNMSTSLDSLEKLILL